MVVRLYDYTSTLNIVLLRSFDHDMMVGIERKMHLWFIPCTISLFCLLLRFLFSNGLKIRMLILWELLSL